MLKLYFLQLGFDSLRAQNQGVQDQKRLDFFILHTFLLPKYIFSNWEDFSS